MNKLSQISSRILSKSRDAEKASLGVKKSQLENRVNDSSLFSFMTLNKSLLMYKFNLM